MHRVGGEGGAVAVAEGLLHRRLRAAEGGARVGAVPGEGHLQCEDEGGVGNLGREANCVSRCLCSFSY
jgi:hypothetical protein